MGEYGKRMREMLPKRIITGCFLLVISVLFFLSLISFYPSSLSLLHFPASASQNWIGKTGDYVAFWLYLGMGWSAYLLVFCIFIASIFCFIPRLFTHRIRRITGFILLILSSSVILSHFRVNMGRWGEIFSGTQFAGGILGNILDQKLTPLFGSVGTPFLVSLILVISFLLLSPGKMVLLRRKEEKPRPAEKKREFEKEEEKAKVPSQTFIPPLPPLSLLNDPPPLKEEGEGILKQRAKKLEEVLEEFGLKGEVVGIHKGPVVTSYEIKPGSGVKVHQILSLADDIALAMKTPSIRIISPIPGKSAIGIEIPNPHPRFVYLKEILASEEFRSSPSKLTLALGKEIQGKPLVADLKQMPHLLIAGTTGSGKTVCLHSLITSILFNAYPQEVKFLLIDPKMVELAPFSTIPHLFSPIVSGSKKAANALKWMVEEMDLRYQKLAEVGVREIERFNERMEEEGRGEEKLPYVVVVIDELADLMTVASREVEDSIMRLAQLSRAAGIHLILATQRPSVDVITGVIKANFPCRISFQVSSKVDSRTILDTGGAEKLLGKGDMLFLPPGSPKPIRAQGCLITEEEIERVVGYLQKMGRPEFVRKEFPEEKKEEEQEVLPAEKDPLFKEAVRVILTTGQASASHLQRRMRIGYARAGRLIDLMEKRGIVGPARGSKPREILVDESYLKELEEED